MNEPVYRWECSICDASGVAESSEAARNMVNRHVALAHPDHPVARRSSQPGGEASNLTVGATGRLARGRRLGAPDAVR